MKKDRKSFLKSYLENLHPGLFFKNFNEIKNRKIKWIIISLLVAFFTYSAIFFYVAIQSDKVTGIKHSYAETMHISKDNLKNFSVGASYYIGKEKHSVISFSKDDEFYVVDFNTTTRNYSEQFKITDNTIKNPNILTQLILFLQDKKGLKLITNIEYISDANKVKINSEEYIVEIYATQLKKVNGEEVDKFYNTLLIQKGQQDLIEKESVPINDLELTDVSVSNSELNISAKEKGKSRYFVFKTTTDEKVNLKTIDYTK